MKGWSWHYARAEELLAKSADPSLQVNAKTNLLAKAQVHATLAAVGYSPRDKATEK